jgi:hypothetical protein
MVGVSTIGAIVAGWGLAVYWALLIVAKHLRTRRFRTRYANRPQLTFEEWWFVHYRFNPPEEWIARGVIEFLGRNLGVCPTCLLPSDALDVGCEEPLSRFLTSALTVSDMVDYVRVMIHRHEGPSCERFGPMEERLASIDNLIRCADEFVRGRRHEPKE